MKKLLLIAGTGDSSAFLAQLPQDITAVATTVSAIGADCIPKREGIKIRTGSLNQEGFAALLQEEQCDFLVDMSHPFAVEVSAAARCAAAAVGVPYLRFQRESYADAEVDCRRFPDIRSAAAALNEISGNVLLTTGSKTVEVFQKYVAGFEERCYLRVLSSSKVLAELESRGIDAGHIFAMKGVASAALNIALAKEIDAVCIVAKDSGVTGGIKEKIAAAKALKIPLFLIDAPAETGAVYATFAEIFAVIREKDEVLL
ncbi:MAG TPA: precorrin-6A reductase [Clostridiales bacterium]|nr:precorrin-6A reductase [Clostridiales bacterium]